MSCCKLKRALTLFPRPVRSIWRVAPLLAVAVVAAPDTVVSQATPVSGLTSITGIKVGHFIMAERPTGCTVILVEDGAVAGGDVRGAAPGTRETALLDPVNTIQQVHAVVLSGGSAFGLSTADGVMRFLEEAGVGFDVGVARVPIVPAAVLFDLSVGDRPDIRPGAACGYEAARTASSNPVVEGNVGAGAGATVGKLFGMGRAMKSGVGSAAVRLPDGLIVAALVAVNSVGDVVDPRTGRVVAGARTEDGDSLIDVRGMLRDWRFGSAVGRPGENTTLAVVGTNARLDKAQVNKVAQMAHDGYARAIYPVHTPADGDAIFALATGDHDGNTSLLVIGALAADVVAEAIVRAVRSAEGLPGLPAARDLAAR